MWIILSDFCTQKTKVLSLIAMNITTSNAKNRIVEIVCNIQAIEQTLPLYDLVPNYNCI